MILHYALCTLHFLMTFPFLGNNCSGIGACFAFRGIVASCTGSDNDGVNANMFAYLNAYDLTTIPWGVLRSETFSSVTLTTPDNLPGGSPVDTSSAVDVGFSQWFVIDNTGAPFSEATGQRCQVWWPAHSQYGVLAIDSWNAYQTAYLACTGVTGACGGNIIEVPMPNSSLPAGVPWNRLRYGAQLGLTSSNIQAFYVSNLGLGVAANYGTGRTSTPSSPWDPTLICSPTPEDPFDGGIP